jgi:hypothetical protein
MQICLRNPRIAGSTDHVLKTTFKNLCTIRDPSTHQGPLNHTAFKPIKSGETVPLRTIKKISLLLILAIARLFNRFTQLLNL